MGLGMGVGVLGKRELQAILDHDYGGSDGGRGYIKGI
jgi:hypothetical protein